MSDLGALETFDSTAFQPNHRFSDDVCGLIVAFAVVFNDFRDLITANQVMQIVAPGDGPPTKERGQFGGLYVHTMRLFAGLINELAELIRKNQNTIGKRAFQQIIRRMPRQARTHWNNLVVAAAATGPKGDRFGKFLYFARNTVAFHYDPKTFARGYLEAFSDPDRPAFLSRGRNMAGTRFYFADAAAERALLRWADATTAKEFMTAGWDVLLDISHALREIVFAYGVARGITWRKPAA